MAQVVAAERTEGHAQAEILETSEGLHQQHTKSSGIPSKSDQPPGIS